MVGVILDFAATFLIAGNSFSSVDHCCQVTARNRTVFVAPRRACGGREMASALRLIQLDLLEAEVEYANRKSVLLFRPLNPVDGDSERAADEIPASARPPFARLTSVR